MLHGQTVAQFLQLPLTERKSILRQHLVQSEPVIIEEGDDNNALNPKISDGVLLLQPLFVGKGAMGKQVVREAREVHYGKNKFWVRLHWLCEFHCDQYDLDAPPAPIAPLVRHIMVETGLHDGLDWENDEEDNPFYPHDGIGIGEEVRRNSPDCIQPSGDIVARRTRKRLEDLFLFTNAEKITLVLRGDGPLDGSDPATRQTIADISVTVKRLIDSFGNRFSIEKRPLGKSRPTRSLLSYWNRPTELTRRDIIEVRTLGYKSYLAGSFLQPLYLPSYLSWLLVLLNITFTPFILCLTQPLEGTFKKVITPHRGVLLVSYNTPILPIQCCQTSPGRDEDSRIQQ
ncbi:hypothetical protein CEP52_016049 [Fusarium oligoseptatum]|uniref:Uncharacterized protein n=1 Tax=Fusarium oligoseptatum TaxID=2604345 RepID=A0A428S7K8_9HYPO|nr:hypothetical protein CEP52_016049 [Fusarium oligoseptatum]